MAIFRAGKRVGPFDIRVGFPRDKSLDNVDRDPRLKQRANTENTIGRFRSMMARAEGYARPARFAVKLFLPSGLKQLALLLVIAYNANILLLVHKTRFPICIIFR